MIVTQETNPACWPTTTNLGRATRLNQTSNEHVSQAFLVGAQAVLARSIGPVVNAFLSRILASGVPSERSDAKDVLDADLSAKEQAAVSEALQPASLTTATDEPVFILGE